MATKPRQIISDEMVDKIISEPKYADGRASWTPKIRKNSSNMEVTVPLRCKYPCSVIVRAHIRRKTSFSVILMYGKQIVIRYNGYHSDHTNMLERDKIRGPHIHKLTERYQEATDRPDGFAVQTDKFSDLSGAIRSFQKDMNIEITSEKNSLDAWLG